MSETGGVPAPQRRTRMSLTIMTEIMIKRIVVMRLRTLERTASAGSGRLVMARSRGVRHGPQRFGRTCCLGFQHRCARRDHSPGAVERALAQLKAEQAVALERPRQREFAGLVGREAEAGVIGHVAKQDHRAMD